MFQRLKQKITQAQVGGLSPREWTEDVLTALISVTVILAALNGAAMS